MKLALISFDGLDPRVIYNNPDDLSTFHSLMGESLHGEWRTPGHTIPSYVTTLTGLPCSDTNFYWDVTNGGFGRHRQLSRDWLWEVTDASMTLLNIPVLYPPEDIEDCMVCGMLTPDNIVERNLALPKETQELLNRIDYIHEVRASKVFDKLGEEGLYDLLVKSMWKRVNAAELLIDKYDSDLFYGVWTATDRWFHRHHTHGVDFYQMYIEADEILEMLLETIPDDIPLVVFSDHGFAHFPTDQGVHTGHMYEGWYSIRHPDLPSFRDDTANIADLFPSVVNYLGGDIPNVARGRILFHREDQDEEVKDRLRELGYIDD